MGNSDALHQNALAYFKHFLQEKISIHLSTVAVAEYAVADDPKNLPLNQIQIESFDFKDAEVAGLFHRTIKGVKANIPEYNRRIITNDVKMLAQISNRKIEAIITKDIASQKEYIKPLEDSGLLTIKFLDINTPLNTALGQLF